MLKYEELKNKIADADFSYWQLGVSLISDEEYDKLIEEFKALGGKDEKIHTPAVQSKGKVKHDRPMLSMQKVYDIEKVIKWAKKYATGRCIDAIEVMPKYDGVALCVRPDGIVTTRGDGKYGEDVTEIAKKFLDTTKPCYGEAVILNNIFEQYLKPLGYQNSRNAVAGILNAKDDEIKNLARYISFFEYRPYYTITALRFIDDGSAFCENIERQGIPYDGIVFRIADEQKFNELGHTDHHWRGQIALKNKNESAKSIIEEIVWTEVNGTITPKAIIKPIKLGGSTITQVTLHNFDRVREWEIKVGCDCVMEKAGGVIPKLVKVIPLIDGTSVKIPTNCPSCGTQLLVNGKRLFCPKCDKRGK